jgi:hypothetical protein
MLSRAMTPFHEYYHAPLRRHPLLMRLVPVLISPFMGGLVELRYAHFFHHRFLGDARRDPDHLIIRGSLRVAVVLSFFQPERSLWFSLARRRVSGPRIVDVLVRAILFAAIVAVLRERFLWYWIPARLLWAANYLAFSRLLHRTPLVIPRLAEIVYVPLLLGSRWMPVFREHEVHHRLPLVAAEHLARFRSVA